MVLPAESSGFANPLAWICIIAPIDFHVAIGSAWLTKKLTDEPQSKGATTTSDALKHVRTAVLQSKEARLSDPETSTHVIVVTDGKCNQL